MRRKLFAILLLLVTPSFISAATTYIVPTTTLAAQTSNNTSAANSFTTQTNGNLGARNVSKVAVQSLLYSGAATKIYAHLLLWFGQSNHMNVGYSSTDPAQVHLQVEDMISRGINGVVIDWYGPNNTIDQATKLVMAEAETHPGFTFAIMIDAGAIEWDSCAGCSPQQALIAQLQYIEQTYFPSPAYLMEQGQPVVTNFSINQDYTIDWNAVDAALSTKPLFWFQNSGGFTATRSDGAFAWVIPTTDDYGMAYLSNFYDTGISFPAEQTVGATYKGFNDTLASWGSGRIMGQQCGQTWLQTFSEINGLYNSGKQLSAFELVTWNDYEEGTEIESGIDNCYTLSASVAGNSLQWTPDGDESTIDHYAVYISADGRNLMSLTNMTAGLTSLNLCSFPIPAGNYMLFVQAVGKPTLANHITGAISYSPSCVSGKPPATISLSASPTSMKIPAGQSGNLTVTATPESGSFNGQVALSCTGLPVGWSCAFAPASVTPGANPANSSLTISKVSQAELKETERRKSVPVYGGWLFSFGIAGFAFISITPSRRWKRALAACALISLGLMATSCGGVSAGNNTVTPTAYTVTINGDSGSSQFSTTIGVTVE
ncbi:MAG TPA: hypothetical protein VN939_17305 [Chthoniobacterales bacterium]|jgi:hypothetical protein|nr:hypothetical protein [Chthoniobacterales bacterium]